MAERRGKRWGRNRVRKLFQGQSSDGLRDGFNRRFRGMAMGERGGRKNRRNRGRALEMLTVMEGGSTWMEEEVVSEGMGKSIQRGKGNRLEAR